MKRLLSHIIILLLLVVAPVSFSTDKIPNFDKPATEITHLKESRKVTNAVVLSSEKLQCLIIVAYLSQIHNVTSISPVFENNLEIPHGRAPPVVPSV